MRWYSAFFAGRPAGCCWVKGWQPSARASVFPRVSLIRLCGRRRSRRAESCKSQAVMGGAGSDCRSLRVESSCRGENAVLGGRGESDGGGVLEGSAASIVFHSRWVSPHREGTDGMRFLWRAGVRSGPSPWSECSGADEVLSRHPAFSAEESPRLGVKTRPDYTDASWSGVYGMALRCSGRFYRPRDSHATSRSGRPHGPVILPQPAAFACAGHWLARRCQR